MSSSWLQCYLSFTLTYLNIVRAVPPHYCLSPLNQSDCGGPPRQVFSYYKPGSRCELETWRGCPTLNMFENEYLCSLNCIFKMGPADTKVNPCDIPLNVNICDAKGLLVYTYINGVCEPVMWAGCPSPNKFVSKSLCETVCLEGAMEKQFFNLDNEPLQQINELLDNIIEDEMATTIAPTEAELSNTTEPVTETVTEAETEATSQVIPETMPEPAPEDIPEITPEGIPETTPEGNEDPIEAENDVTTDYVPPMFGGLLNSDE